MLATMPMACYSHPMTNLQVKNIPDDLHDRLRRYAQRKNCTIGAAVLAAIEHELAMSEWKERYAELPETQLSAPAATLIATERQLRDDELSNPGME